VIEGEGVEDGRDREIAQGNLKSRMCGRDLQFANDADCPLLLDAAPN